MPIQSKAEFYLEYSIGYSVILMSCYHLAPKTEYQV